jgi:hypothetical protein
VGAVTKGHFADLIAVEGDPLQDMAALRNVDFVMKGGAIVKAGASPWADAAAMVTTLNCRANARPWV